MLRQGHRTLVLACSTVVLLGLISAGGQDGSADGLRPVMPDESASEAPEPVQAEAPSTTFDADQWTQRLQVADLDERERYLDALVGEALRSAPARAWIETTATGTDELAWTARMARRELERHARAQIDPIWGDPFAQRGLSFGLPGGRDPFGGGAGLLDDLWKQLDALGGRGLGAPGGVAPGGGGTSNRGFSFSLTPDGVRVEVTEMVDGAETVQTYEAESLEALLEQHPELRDRIGSAGASPFGRRIFGSTPTVPTPSEPLRTDILGVLVTAEESTADRPAGLQVHDTVPGTIAHLLGVSRGDLLLELNGVQMDAVQDISKAMGQRDESGEVRLRLMDARGVERTRVWRPIGS